MLNAFVLGAKSVNPDMTMKVRWLDTFMDPATAMETANALVDKGLEGTQIRDVVDDFGVP